MIIFLPPILADIITGHTRGRASYGLKTPNNMSTPNSYNTESPSAEEDSHDDTTSNVLDHCEDSYQSLEQLEEPVDDQLLEVPNDHNANSEAGLEEADSTSPEDSAHQDQLPPSTRHGQQQRPKRTPLQAERDWFEKHEHLKGRGDMPDPARFFYFRYIPTVTADRKLHKGQIRIGHIHKIHGDGMSGYLSMLKGTSAITFSFSLRRDPPRDADFLNDPFPFRAPATRKRSFLERNPFAFFKILQTGQNRTAKILSLLSSTDGFAHFANSRICPLRDLPAPSSAPSPSYSPAPRPSRTLPTSTSPSSSCTWRTSSYRGRPTFFYMDPKQRRLTDLLGHLNRRYEEKRERRKKTRR